MTLKTYTQLVKLNMTVVAPIFMVCVVAQFFVRDSVLGTILLAIAVVSFLTVGAIASWLVIRVLVRKVPLTCPFCEEPGELIPDGSYTWFHCETCGWVRSKGLFKSRFTTSEGPEWARDHEDDADPPSQTEPQ